VRSQTFQHDWLGNTTQTGDDAGGFYWDDHEKCAPFDSLESSGTIERGDRPTAHLGPFAAKAAARPGARVTVTSVPTGCGPVKLVATDVTQDAFEASIL
jgi:hypothetical protein